RLQKIDDLRTLDRTSVQPEIETQERESSNRRQTLPVEIELENGGLPAGRPRATPMRPLAQSAFVDEDDRAPFSARFFLIVGQFFLFQLRLSSTPVSLRSGTVAPSVQRSGEPPSHVVPPRTDSNPRLVNAWLQNGASREHQNRGERQRDFPSLMRRKIVP